MYFNKGLLSGIVTDTILAWRIRALSHEFGTVWLAFINAHTGDISFLSTEGYLHDCPLCSHSGDRCHENFDIDTISPKGFSVFCWGLPWEIADDEWFDEGGHEGGVPDGEGWLA